MRNIFANGGAQAAGRDIKNVNLHLPSIAPESQLQAEFAQRTGIWCPKPAREWLENLMHSHRFTAKELAIAWNAGSVGWDADIDTKKIVTPLIEAIAIYFLVLVLATLFGLSSLAWIRGEMQNDLAGAASFFGLAAAYLATCWLANRFMLKPRRVAQRIKRIEAEHEQPCQG